MVLSHLRTYLLFCAEGVRRFVGKIYSQTTTPNILQSNCHFLLASSSIDDTVPVVIILSSNE